MQTYVITFESTHAAMAAQKALSEQGLAFRTIPVPTVISAGCGIAVRFDAEDPRPHVRAVEQVESVRTVSLYLRESATQYSALT